MKTVFIANGYGVAADQAMPGLADFIVLQFLLLRGMEPDYFNVSSVEITAGKHKKLNFDRKHVQSVFTKDGRVMVFGDTKGMEMLRAKKSIAVNRELSSVEVLRNLKDMSYPLLPICETERGRG